VSDQLTSQEREKRRVFHSWSAQASISPLMISGASGSRVYTEDGAEFLDFSSQLVFTNLGHQHPAVVMAIKDQADVLCTIAPQHGYRSRYRAAEMIVEHSFPGAAKVFFTNGGTESVEHAVRMARLVTGRHKILSAYRSYHGATTMSMNLTGDPRRWASDQGTAGVVHFFGPFLYRSPFFSDTLEQECQRALAHLEDVISFEGPSTIAALIFETIPGTAGIILPPPGYLTAVRELCRRHGILFIADEVMVGFGRVGEWFAYDAEGFAPDLVTFAKGVNSGYVPLGGVVLSEAISSAFDTRAYPGGLTYSGHPLACAAAVATMTVMEEQDVVGHARCIGESHLGPGLRELQARHPSMGEVRGKGVFFAIELVTDRATKAPLSEYGTTSAPMAQVVTACRDQGLLIFQNHHRLHCAPPCTISPEDVADGLARLDRALNVADSFYVGAS
jgi:taurine--2-oxoglutarate transaminase